MAPASALQFKSWTVPETVKTRLHVHKGQDHSESVRLPARMDPRCCRGFRHTRVRVRVRVVCVCVGVGVGIGVGVDESSPDLSVVGTSSRCRSVFGDGLKGSFCHCISPAPPGFP